MPLVLFLAPIPPSSVLGQRTDPRPPRRSPRPGHLGPIPLEMVCLCAS
ncbi:hypothetical protein PVAP13_8KG324012 [Panicum virgatum]|uniref:Uncharacterized protein n=1 Tax=Panicum virgatum TaxID=38727 RepID=A0A8T0PXE6_PANVG|nr:hypothetical protein PVAP13_8KG324012 [Panicum virgatum]